MSSYADIIKKCKKDWACPDLMESVNKVSGEKIPFSSPSINYATYGGIPKVGLIHFFGFEGSGKAQPLYSKVLTPRGFVAMGDISVGDTVFDGKGNLCHVTAIFPQGKRPIYEITAQGQNKIRVADNHLNSVWIYNYRTKKREDYVWDTKTLIDKFNNRKYKRIRIDIPTVEFPEVAVPLDPYLLGALLGDGGLHDRGIHFTNSESDIVSKMNNLLDQYHYELYDARHDEMTWAVRRQSEYYIPGKKTYLHKSLEDLGVKVKSVDKFIPEVYLYNSYEVRIKLLQGLFDTDGYIDAEGSVSFSTSSKQLSEDFAFLVRSLGIRDSITSKEPAYTCNGEKHPGHIAYIHYLKIPNGLPFYTSEKHSARYKDRQQPPLRNIVSIDYIGEEDCQCIMVDSPEHTYISDDFMVTHNTTTAMDLCKTAYDMFAADYAKEVSALEEKISGGAKEYKAVLADLKERGPKKVLYIDIEHTFDRKWAATLGLSEVLEVMQTPNVAAEEILNAIQNLIETGEMGLIIMDSVPSLVPASELKKKIGERTVAALAGLMTEFCRRINPILFRGKCALLLINQQRENMDNPYVDRVPGGRAIRFYSSLELSFKRGSPLDFLGNEVPQKTENPAGYKIVVTVKKQKTAPFDRKLAEYYLMAKTGLRVDFEFVQLAINKYDIIHKQGGWYYFKDPETKELLEVDGNDVKVNGLPKVYDYIQIQSDYYQKLCDFIVNDINTNGLSVDAELEGEDE